MGHIDWKSFFMGVLAYWLWQRFSGSFTARVG
jgi:hypothetical protein